MAEAPSSLVEALARQVAAMAQAGEPSGVLELALEGTRLAAPRAVLFLIRHGRLRGWRSVGYPREADRRLASLDADPGFGWLGRVALEPRSMASYRQPGEQMPEFGQPVSVEACALPLRIHDKTVGFLVAERGEGEPPLSPGVLALLSDFAELRLGLDLARGMSGRRRPESAPGTASPWQNVHVEPDAGPGPLHVPDGETGLAPVPDEVVADQQTSGRREEARRFARLVATDIRLYNEEAVLMGRRQRDLAHRLGDQLARGRESFLRRFPDLGREGLELLHEAYVQVLAAGDSALLPPGSGPTSP